MQTAQVAFRSHLGDYLGGIYECRERHSEKGFTFHISSPCPNAHQPPSLYALFR